MILVDDGQVRIIEQEENDVDNPKELEWKDPEPKPPDKNRTLAELTDRLQHESAELQGIIVDLRELLASL